MSPTPTPPEIDDIDFLLLREPNYGRREWWAAKFPGFTPEQCEILEIQCWAEAEPKEIKGKIKKLCRKRESSR